MKPNSTELLSELIDKHINDPTREMRVTFRKLSTAHKWLLFSILDLGDRLSFLSRPEDMSELERRFDTLCPPEDHQPFDSVLTEMSEGFVRIVNYGNGPVGATWIHPSCQDLTIEELARLPKERLRFLKNSSISGLEKAIGSAGGSEGNRSLPLLVTDLDWTALQERCIALLEQRDDIIALLLRSLQAISTANVKIEKTAKLRATIASIWPYYLQRINLILPSNASAIERYFEMRRIASARNRLPHRAAIWQTETEDVIAIMDGNDVIEESISQLRSFRRIAQLFSVNEPSFWKMQTTQSEFQETLSRIVRRIEEEINVYPDHYETKIDELNQAASDNSELSDEFEELRKIAGVHESTCAIFKAAKSYFESHSNSLSDEASELSPSDIDVTEDMDTAAEIDDREVSLDKLFEDL